MPKAYWITSALWEWCQVTDAAPKSSQNDQGTTPGGGFVWYRRL